MQRADAGALRTLSFENHENKNQVCKLIIAEVLHNSIKTTYNLYMTTVNLNSLLIFQIVECNALPALTLLLCSEDVTIQK